MTLPGSRRSLRDSILSFYMSGYRNRQPVGNGPPPASSAEVPHIATFAFISYRRETGADTARLIRAELLSRGMKTFLDVDDLGSFHFDERLLQEIEGSPHFILILSPGALDRCIDEDDWLRREIAHAISKDRNIVPVLKEGFRFPPKKSLPSDIADLPRYNCVQYSHTYFEATIDKLLDFCGGASPARSAGETRAVGRTITDSDDYVRVSDFLVARHPLTGVSWLHAVEYAKTLHLGDRTGWRLPSKGQLRRIWDAGLFEKSRYHSREETKDHDVWYMNFEDGHFNVAPKTYDQGISAIFVGAIETSAT